jgi:chromosome segregation ATPase
MSNKVFLDTASKILTEGLVESVVGLAEELTKANSAAAAHKPALEEYEERIQHQLERIEALDAEKQQLVGRRNADILIHTAKVLGVEGERDAAKTRATELEAERDAAKTRVTELEAERDAAKKRAEELEAEIAENKKGRDADRATWTEWHKQYEERFNALLADYNRVTGKA